MSSQSLQYVILNAIKFKRHLLYSFVPSFFLSFSRQNIFILNTESEKKMILKWTGLLSINFPSTSFVSLLFFISMNNNSKVTSSQMTSQTVLFALQGRAFIYCPPTQFSDQALPTRRNFSDRLSYFDVVIHCGVLQKASRCHTSYRILLGSDGAENKIQNCENRIYYMHFKDNALSNNDFKLFDYFFIR